MLSGESDIEVGKFLMWPDKGRELFDSGTIYDLHLVQVVRVDGDRFCIREVMNLTELEKDYSTLRLLAGGHDRYDNVRVATQAEIDAGLEAAEVFLVKKRDDDRAALRVTERNVDAIARMRVNYSSKAAA